MSRTYTITQAPIGFGHVLKMFEEDEQVDGIRFPADDKRGEGETYAMAMIEATKWVDAK